ncbi:MAG: hypothetical protein JNM23_04760 [Bradyrhizobiaceae bacterium]|nr:hypothetical protein [Bradyrhizobiaceae bacterium]
MRKDEQKTLMASREALWRAIGVSRRIIWTTHFACAALAVGIIAQGVERWSNARACENKVSVIEIPESGLPSHVLTRYEEWVPSDGVWIAAAREWVWLVRSRSSDVGTERYQVRQLAATTAQDLWLSVDAWRKEQAGALSKSSAEVEIVEATIVDRARPDRATAHVTWRERILGENGPGPWTSQGGTITLAKSKPQTVEEVEKSPTGLLTVAFSHTALPADSEVSRR